MTDDPAAYPRRILLATIGLAPQIVTETLYALCRQRTIPFVPHEIHIITTVEGEKCARQSLVDPTAGKLAQFATEFGLPQLAAALPPERIHVIRDITGAPLSDISTEGSNAAAADLIIEVMHELTSDPKSALHISIAGGRKTMGFLMGTALSLFGRPQDRLSHVLVEPQLERDREFFYPSKHYPHMPMDKADARVVLADIPFVRLRDGLPQPLIDGAWNYSETVARAQRAVAPPELILDPESQLVSCHGIVFHLSPMQFAMYAVMAKIRLADPEGDRFVHWTKISGEDFITEFTRLPDTTIAEITALKKDFGKIGRPGYEDDDPRAGKYQQAKARLNGRLAAQLGPYSSPYELKIRKAANGQWLMGLDLPATTIRFAPISVARKGDDAE